MLQAGFSEIDITPPLGTHKIGWLRDIVTDRVNDPLYARVAVFDAGDTAVGFIQLDTLSIRWTQVQDIRARITNQFGFPGEHVMVTATHNHAGPAVANIGEVKRDEAYIETLVHTCVAAFGEAWENRQPAEIGFGHTFEWKVAHNRRVVMRDGTVRTHGSFTDPNALYLEGPIDPEVAVLAARGATGQLLGMLVNFTCHPTHFGGDGTLSAGYPGVLANGMKSRGCPVTLFLNGACGDIHTADPIFGKHMEMDEAGQRLAVDVERVLQDMSFTGGATLAARKTTVQLPYRAVTDEETRGAVRGAQRFIDPAIYDAGMPALIERIRTRGTQPAEVQVLSINEVDVVGIPAEYFVAHQLRIKEKAFPRHALVAGHTNGMVGYVPTQAAFARGGYETTFSAAHRMAPEAGDILTDAAIALVTEKVTA